MKAVEVMPVGDGKHTEITVSMSAEDAARFMELYSRGELSRFGVVDAKLVASAATQDQKASWADDVGRPPSGQSGRDPQNR